MAISAAKRVDIWWPCILTMQTISSISNGRLTAALLPAMLDASALPFEENVKMTNEVVAPVQAQRNVCRGRAWACRRTGRISGRLWGRFCVYGSGRSKGICEADGHQCACGLDRHGARRSKSEPKLNLKRLEELNEALDVPLVMHGGSGLTDDDFRNAVARGITKTNIFTDLTIAAMNALKTQRKMYTSCSASML